MAVVPRKRKKSTTYYVATFVPATGKTHWEKVGTDKREAARVDARRKKEVEDGAFGVQRKSSMPLGDFLRAWRKERRTRNAEDDEKVIDNYLLTPAREWLMRVPLDELDPPHGIRLVKELLATVSEETSKPLSHKYVSNIYGLYTSAIRSARLEKLIVTDPCLLPRGLLRRKAKRGTKKPYDMQSVRTLCVDAPMSEGRVFSALAFYTGQREGEACGRRWRDINPEAQPLACLDIKSQYNDQPLKTNQNDEDTHDRKAPIHPELAATLKLWWEEGFEWTYCRKPGPDDFIVPRTKDGQPHTRSSGYKLFRAHAEACGVSNLSLHSSRHTFLTLTTRHGADKAVAEKITHNRRGEVVDEYIHKEWVELCEVTMLFDAHFDAANKARGIEWRRWESNRGALPAKHAKDRQNPSEATPHDTTGKDEKTHVAAPTIARVKVNRQLRTRSGLGAIPKLPDAVHKVVRACLREALPLALAGDRRALLSLERGARAIDGALGEAL